MTKREQYGLAFSKTIMTDGEIISHFSVEILDNRKMLILLTFLDENATDGFIWDLERCLATEGNVDEGFYHDHFLDTKVLYQYPNVNFGDIYLIPMVELKGILEEWLEFLKS